MEHRWSPWCAATAWPLAMFYGFISIMEIVKVSTLALPIDITRNESKVERVLGGSRTFSGVQVPPPEILRFMRRFGYLADGSGGGGNGRDGNLLDAEALYHESAIVEAIKNVQKYGALRQTGKLDNDTLNLLSSPRCGVPDIEGTPYYLMTAGRKARRHKRYVVGARPWEKRRIRYFFANWSYRISRVQIERDFASALQLWSKHGNLHFIRVNSTTADIIVGFGRGYHGDGFPFDGPGGILAHAYYPYDQGSFGGDIHFDEDENWLNDLTSHQNGIDFQAVAAHEIGHSLGLAHSPIATSIMFPYYKGQQQLSLDDDDITAMREIYFDRSLLDDGPIYREIFYAPTQRTTTTLAQSTNATATMTFQGDYESVMAHKLRHGQALAPTTSSTLFSNEIDVENSTIPDVCVGSFDAVTAIQGFIHVFKGAFVWKLNSSYSIFEGYPKSIHQLFPFFRDAQIESIDAAYERFDGAIVLFSASNYWVFNATSNFLISNGPISYFFGNTVQLPKVNAALVWPKNNLTYFFGNTNFCRYNDHRQSMNLGYPKPMAHWPGIPNDVDAAATLTNGKTYFFKRNLYWLYNNKFLRPARGYPRLVGPAWFKDLCVKDSK